MKMQLEREKRIRKILQCANAALNSSINARLYATEGLYKEDPVKYNIHILCDAFGVTRRLFYGHIKYNKRDNAWFKTRIPALKKCIRDIFNESEQRFGADKITVIMKERGLHVSVTIVRRLMREMRLHSIRTGAKRRWRLEIRNPA
ncbi:MAG: IS3 family transposase [Kiritimatiellae bacterium]|nr:IS3 family transposase [Kiritimatiellia bacterium]